MPVPSQPSRLLRGRKRALTAGTLLMSAALAAGTARAAPPTVSLGSDTTGSTSSGSSGGLFGFTQNIERSNYLLGDMWGLRPALAQYGVTLNILDTEEVLGNATGGTHKGVDYDGLTQMVLQVDTQRAFGLYGGLFNISALQIHGRNLSADNLQTLQTASGIESDRSTRLWELWYQQKFLDEDRLDVKVGQQSLDQEFIVSQNALYFVNTMFGWPMLPSADLPGGGPAYPLSALGARVRFRPTDSLTLLTGVFNGSPVRNNNGDPQKQNPSGTSFPLNGGALVFSEIQFAYPSLGTMETPGSSPLSGTYKLGFYYDTENFSDLRYDYNGTSLADPDSNGQALAHHGNWGIYAVADQMIWRSEEDSGRNLNFFTRIMGAPQGDRNLVDFSLNAGLTLHNPFPGGTVTRLASAWAMRMSAAALPDRTRTATTSMAGAPSSAAARRSSRRRTSIRPRPGCSSSRTCNMSGTRGPGRSTPPAPGGSRTNSSPVCAPTSCSNPRETPS